MSYEMLLAVRGWFERLKMREDFFSGFCRHDFAEFFDAGALQIGDAAKLTQQLLNGARPDAGNVAESGFCLTLAAAVAVKGHRETVCFIANLLDEMKHRGVAVQNAGLVFLAKDVENFFFFG